MLPVVGYLLSGYRCRRCGARLSFLRPLVELLTSFLFVLLYLIYLGPATSWEFPYSPLEFKREHLVAIFVYHCILVSLLLMATFIDLDMMIIPDSVTVPGMLLGIVLGTFWYVELHPVPLWSPPRGTADLEILSNQQWMRIFGSEKPVPVEWETTVAVVNEHYKQNWNRWLGFSTSIVGLLVGGGVVWIVRAICTWVFGREAMGFGDVTLMAMVGSFVGWQTAVIAFFLAPIPAVVVGVLGLIFSGKNALPYGPHLSISTLFCVLFWRPLWQYSAHIFFDFAFFLLAAFVMLVMLVIVATMVQMGKRIVLRVTSRDT
jgi:leader peptidase (prepilin peptidase)/N-methyltransferase